MKREIQCKKCGVTFFSGTRGAIPDFCPSCKYQGYKDRHYHYQRKDPGLFPSGRIIKKLCLEQDKYQCALCGNTDNPSIHHKDGKSYYRFKLNTNNSLDNLITLCSICHKKEENNARKRAFVLRGGREQGRGRPKCHNH